MLLCGDLTDYGTPEEAHVLAEELAAARLPIVAVLGNHDYESGQQDQVRQILTDAGVRGAAQPTDATAQSDGQGTADAKQEDVVEADYEIVDDSKK